MFIKANSFLRRKSTSPTPVIVDVAKMSSFNYPYTPREPSTVSLRSSSMSTLGSSTSSTRRSSSEKQVSHDNLYDRAVSILNGLSNPTPDFTSLSPYISDSVFVQLNDNQPTTSRTALFDHWETKRSQWPEFRYDLQDVCVDETQNKVWVTSRIHGGPGLAAGRVRQNVKMMFFDDAGVLIKSIDSSRVTRTDD